MVIWTHLISSDLKHIHNFIAEDSKHYAKKINILNRLPNIGKMVPEVAKNSNHYMLAVIHKKRDFEAEDLL